MGSKALDWVGTFVRFLARLRPLNLLRWDEWVMSNMPTFQTDNSVFIDENYCPARKRFHIIRFEPSTFLQSNREFTTDFTSVSTYLIACVLSSCFKFSRFGESGLKSPENYLSPSRSNLSNWLSFQCCHVAILVTREFKGRRLIRIKVTAEQKL